MYRFEKKILLRMDIYYSQVDKDGASPDRVMQELSSVGLMPEAWGGDTPMVQVRTTTDQQIVLLYSLLENTSFVC